MKQVYTTKEAAELLQCHESTVRRAVEGGKLKAVKIGRDLRLSRADLAEFWSAQGGGILFDNFTIGGILNMAFEITTWDAIDKDSNFHPTELETVFVNPVDNKVAIIMDSGHVTVISTK